MSPLARIVSGLIRVYQLGVSPLLGAPCRFHPSCSTYAREAVATFGAIRGGGLAVKRLLRCHPWGGHGIDPVPEAGPDGRPRSERRERFVYRP